MAGISQICKVEVGVDVGRLDCLMMIGRLCLVSWHTLSPVITPTERMQPLKYYLSTLGGLLLIMCVPISVEYFELAVL